MDKYDQHIKEYLDRDKNVFSRSDFQISKPSETYYDKVMKLDLGNEIILKFDKRKGVLISLGIILLYGILLYLLKDFDNLSDIFMKIGYGVFAFCVYNFYKTSESNDILALNNKYLMYNRELYKWEDIDTFRIVKYKRFFKLSARPFNAEIMLVVFLKNGKMILRDISEIPIPKYGYSYEHIALLSFIQYFSKIKE